MSYSFTAANFHYADRTTSVPLSGTPLSMIGWVKVADVALTRTICSIYAASTLQNYFTLDITTAELPRATTRGNIAGTISATGSGAVPLNTWVLAHGGWGSATDREAGHTAGNYGTNSTTLTPNTTPSAISIGMREGINVTNPFDGLIAIVGVYSVKLSDAQLEELVLTEPASASLSSASLVALYDMRTDHGTTTVSDSVGTFHLTLAGTTGKPTFDADNPTFGATAVTSRMALLGVG